MQTAVITTALEHGAQLKDVQKAAGHRDPGTTKLYDRCGHNPEKAASFFGRRSGWYVSSKPSVSLRFSLN